jgi:monofunctional glycosyltransferase
VKRLLKILAALLLVAVTWLFAVWPPPVWYRTHWPATTAFMAARESQTPKKAKQVRLYRPVPLDSIVPALRDAVVIGEDNNFPVHRGIDYLALAHAIGYQRDSFSWASSRDRSELFSLLPHAWGKREKLRGASTITQQLAKNLYLSASRNPLRKVKEAVTAYRLEGALGKPRILELYLNVVELGPGVWGAEAAGEHYFDRHAIALTREQAAALAATLPFPLTSNPDFRPGRMRWRQNLILRRMGGEWVEVPKEETEDEPLNPAAELLAPPPFDTTAVDSIVPDTAAADSQAPEAPADSVTAPPDSS